MFKKALLLFLFILTYQFAFAQEENEVRLKYYTLGIETQVYPTGVLLGVRGSLGFKQQSIDFRLGYNFVNHRDQGIQAHEEGGGFGFTMGYRYYRTVLNLRFFVGVRSDLWFNTIHWEGRNNSGSGTTNIVVLQPTVIVGYLFLFKERWTVTPTLAFGWELNIYQQGEPVGHGAILLAGLNLSHRFYR